MVFKCKAVVDETHIRKSKSVCKSFFGNYASQVHPYSMCHPMLTGLYTKNEFGAFLQKFEFKQI